MRGTEFAELSAFVAVADRGSFARAADDLGIVPSTLSQTIRSLEDRLGVRLLHRTTRSVSLTEAGERLHARIRPAFTEMSSAVESINDFRDTPTGTLRLNVSTIPVQMILAPMLKKIFGLLIRGSVFDITTDNSTAISSPGGLMPAFVTVAGSSTICNWCRPACPRVLSLSDHRIIWPFILRQKCHRICNITVASVSAMITRSRSGNSKRTKRSWMSRSADR